MEVETIVTGESSDTQFVHADCVEWMSAQPERSVDVIVTSPPYNLGVKYDEYNDSRPWSAYQAWTGSWLHQAKRILKTDGSLFVNVGWKSSCLDVAEQVYDVAKRQRWGLQNKIAWVKSVTVNISTSERVIREAAAKFGLTGRDVARLVRAFHEVEGEGLERTVGHFKPINSPRFLNDCFEMIYHLTHGQDVHIDRLAVGVAFEDKANVARFGAEGRPDKRCRGNTWLIPYETIQSSADERPHPATFPLDVPERCIKLHGIRPGMRVLDVFGGSGTTALACAKLGVSCVSVEVSANYHMMSQERTKAWVEERSSAAMETE
jgi:site-specific DNA-methyltransferase (adenine-specific)